MCGSDITPALTTSMRAWAAHPIAAPRARSSPPRSSVLIDAPRCVRHRSLGHLTCVHDKKRRHHPKPHHKPRYRAALAPSAAVDHAARSSAHLPQPSDVAPAACALCWPCGSQPPQANARTVCCPRAPRRRRRSGARGWHHLNVIRSCFHHVGRSLLRNPAQDIGVRSVPAQGFIVVGEWSAHGTQGRHLQF